HRALQSQARHAHIALSPVQFKAVDEDPDRVLCRARKAACDSLSALVMATRRSRVAPRAVRRSLEPLELLLSHGYQLLSQLTTVKTMLLMLRDEDQSDIQPVLRSATEEISNSLRDGRCGGASPEFVRIEWGNQEEFSDPFVYDLKPCILRRLNMAQELAANMARDASAALKPSGEQRLP